MFFKALFNTISGMIFANLICQVIDLKNVSRLNESLTMIAITWSVTILSYSILLALKMH